LTQALSAKEGYYNMFHCGNLKTLQKPGVREALLDFHKTWYSSNIMNLCICGKFEIQQLEQWVVEKFSPVVNKEVVVPSFSEPASYPPSHLGKLVKYVPVKDEDVLSLFFVLDYSGKDHKTNPLDYFVQLVGHEGEHSLLSYLISQGWALELCTDVDHTLDYMSFFTVDITLTAKGLENSEQVIEAAFKCFQRISEAGPQA